jgi:hypothetical protein
VAEILLLSSKVTTLLLTAVSAERARDVISERKTDPAEILFRILTLYQPGGLEERNTLLKLLREAKKGTTPATAVAAMKDWERIRKRAEEMKLTLPAPTEQWKCVRKMVETAVSANAELSFRFSMKRLELQIDQKTSATAVATMFRFRLAELTALATIEEPKNSPNAKKVKAKTKAAAKTPHFGARTNPMITISRYMANSTGKLQREPFTALGSLLLVKTPGK